MPNKTRHSARKAKHIAIHSVPKGLDWKPCQVILIDPSWDPENPTLRLTDSMGPNEDLIVSFRPLVYEPRDPAMITVPETNYMSIQLVLPTLYNGAYPIPIATIYFPPNVTQVYATADVQANYLEPNLPTSGKPQAESY